MTEVVEFVDYGFRVLETVLGIALVTAFTVWALSWAVSYIYQKVIGGVK